MQFLGAAGVCFLGCAATMAQELLCEPNQHRASSGECKTRVYSASDRVEVPRFHGLVRRDLLITCCSGWHPFRSFQLLNFLDELLLKAVLCLPRLSVSSLVRTEEESAADVDSRRR